MDSMKGTAHSCTLWRASKSGMALTSSSMCDSATAAPTCRWRKRIKTIAPRTTSSR